MIRCVRVQCLRVSHTQPVDDVVTVMRERWRLLQRRETTCGLAADRSHAPRFIVSLIGSAPSNDIRPRVRIQYIQTLMRLIQFVERTRTPAFASNSKHSQIRRSVLTFVCRRIRTESLTSNHSISYHFIIE